MYWSVSLIVMASLGAPDAQTTYGSYTKAYRAANAVHRPMLVVMNPAGENVSQQEVITAASLQQDERTRAMLNGYVVAIIDTGTEHGQAVHNLFGNPELPRIVVIDERQEKQVFQSSEPLEPAALARVLKRYRTNAAAPAPGSLDALKEYLGIIPPAGNSSEIQ